MCVQQRKGLPRLASRKCSFIINAHSFLQKKIDRTNVKVVLENIVYVLGAQVDIKRWSR